MGKSSRSIPFSGPERCPPHAINLAYFARTDTRASWQDVEIKASAAVLHAQDAQGGDVANQLIMFALIVERQQTEPAMIAPECIPNGADTFFIDIDTPYLGAAIGIGFGEEAVDGGLEIDNRSEHAPLEPPPGEP